MPNIGELLYNLQNNHRRLYRAYESKNKQKINNEWSYKFNETCLSSVKL